MIICFQLNFFCHECHRESRLANRLYGLVPKRQSYFHDQEDAKIACSFVLIMHDDHMLSTQFLLSRVPSGVASPILDSLSASKNFKPTPQLKKLLVATGKWASMANGWPSHQESSPQLHLNSTSKIFSTYTPTQKLFFATGKWSSMADG